ncbi:MAG: NYN domain-containing protein [Pseudomonadota bacterium]|nr:NYN domain-containing protein [Pseudomonadota bacterium]
MSSSDRTFFLIDADNVSVAVIEAALEQKLLEHGALHVRRCYCSADFAVKNLAFLKLHSIRPMVNATAGKNCTDIALAIDAVQLCGEHCPSVVVIVASDSDFAPLVLHLRELGCRVEGVGQEGKTGAESHLAYDHFADVPMPRKRAGVKAAAAAPRSAPRPAPRSSASAPTPAPPPRPRSPHIDALPADVLGWLASVPGLASGAAVELRKAAEALRKDGLLARNASSTRLFKRYPGLFLLLPAGQPNSVQYRAASRT